MKIKFKLSVMMIAIVVVVAGSIAIIQLRQASGISLELNKKSLKNLTTARAEMWKGKLNVYLEAVRSVANIMGEYEAEPAEERRDRFDSMLLATLIAQPDFVRIFSIWKPNALDGMDSQYIGRTGSTPTGQYAMTYGRDTGQIIPTPNLNITETIDHITGPNARKDRIEPPLPFIVNGKETYIIRMGTPIINRRTNEVVGTVTCLFNVSSIQPVLEYLISSHEEVFAASIYFNNGFILASFQPDRIGKTLIDAELQYGNYKTAANEAVNKGEFFETYNYLPSLNMNLQIELISFPIGNSDVTWSIMIATNDEVIMAEVNSMTKFTVLLASIAIITAAIMVFFALNKITKPIVTAAETLKDISEGEGDLTRTITASSNDEIGSLALYFNKTLEKIKKLVITIKHESAKLSDIGTDLSSNMSETAVAINQITANIQSIKGRIINQSASVSETNATVEQVIENINKLKNHIEHQSDNVSQASSAIVEMVANIHSVTATLTKNEGNVKTLQDASEVGRGGLQEVAADIQEIARESEGLLDINSVMENIASQTNLLSMNAAIEAAHAGEAGKGFAVVADEIRKLAESSGDQSKIISAVLKKIKVSIDKIILSAENVLTRFEAIDFSIRTVAEQEENIRKAMEEQSVGSKQLLDIAGSLSDITQQVRNSCAEMFEGSKEVMNESRNLENVTQEITGGINEMASGAEEVNTAVHHVNGISSRNSEGIETLMKEVARFKVA